MQDDVSQTQCKDAERSERQCQTPSAKTRLSRKNHERQRTERRQECWKRERAVWLTRRVDQSISAHTGLSRGVPADHEVQSQVKKRRQLQT